MAAKIADEFSWFRGMENTYMDMYDEPEWMHAALRKITDNFKARFRMLEDAGIWGTLDNSEPLDRQDFGMLRVFRISGMWKTLSRIKSN